MEKQWCIIYKKIGWLGKIEHGFIEISAHKEMSARKKAGEYLPHGAWIEKTYVEYRKREVK